MADAVRTAPRRATLSAAVSLLLAAAPAAAALFAEAGPATTDLSDAALAHRSGST